MPDATADWLLQFDLDPALLGPVRDVMNALPGTVRRGLVDDPSFVMCDYEPSAGGHCIPMRFGDATNLATRPSARAVVLKRTLSRRPVAFVRWVIAHELAHAHLRNGGRWPGEEPEAAADALAAEWGFPRPT